MDLHSFGTEEESQSGPSGRVVGAVVALIVCAALLVLLLNNGSDNTVSSSRSVTDVTSLDRPSTTLAAAATTQPPAPTSVPSAVATSSTNPPSASQAPLPSTTAVIASEPPVANGTGATVGQPSYPVLPDGRPAPIVEVFDTDTITITGVLPSANAKARLEAFALATSRFPDAQIVSSITIDPTMPNTVGVRMIDLNAVGFPERTSDITNELAVDLDRILGILNLLDHLSVDVIGHADQRGTPGPNFSLSESRAQSVTRYLVDNGIAPERLTARAMGSESLLTDDTSNEGRALNRRVDFVLYGLLVDP